MRGEALLGRASAKGETRTATMNARPEYEQAIRQPGTGPPCSRSVRARIRYMTPNTTAGESCRSRGPIAAEANLRQRGGTNTGLVSKGWDTWTCTAICCRASTTGRAPSTRPSPTPPRPRRAGRRRSSRRRTCKLVDVAELPDRVQEVRDALRDAAGRPLHVEVGGEKLKPQSIGDLDDADLEVIAHGPPGARWLLYEVPFEGVDGGGGPASSQARRSCATAATACCSRIRSAARTDPARRASGDLGPRTARGRGESPPTSAR